VPVKMRSEFKLSRNVAVNSTMTADQLLTDGHQDAGDQPVRGRTFRRVTE
jgi:hypothetical protein